MNHLHITDFAARQRILRYLPVTLVLICVSGQLSASDQSKLNSVMAFSQAGRLSSEQIRDTANRIMQQRDYRGVRRRVLENVPASESTNNGFLIETLESMGSAVGDFFEWLFSGFTKSRRPRRVRPANRPAPTTTTASSSGDGFDFSFSKVMLYIGLAILILFAIWIISSIVRKTDPNRKLNRRGLFGEEEDITDLSVPPGELAASTYESRAIQMAADGNFRAAIRELLIGSMSWIERAGLIRFRKGLTNRDYMRAVWKQKERRMAYAATAIEFERIYFGRRTATQAMFENCLNSFQGSFREDEETPIAAV